MQASLKLYEDMMTEASSNDIFVMDYGSEVTISTDESIFDTSISSKYFSSVLNENMCDIDLSENTFSTSVCDKNSSKIIVEDINNISVDVNTTSQNTLGYIVTQSECGKTASGDISVDSHARIFPNISRNVLKKSLETGSTVISRNFLKNKENMIKTPSERIKFSTIVKYKEKSNEEIIYWIMELGLYASNIFCPKCNKNMQLCESKKCKDSYMWKCYGNRENKHKLSKSVRTGSFLAGSNLCVLDMLMLIHCWVYKVPRDWIKLEISPSTASLAYWFDFYRDVCVEICARENRKIGGIDKIVEIEGEKYVRQKNGQNIKDSFVFIGTEDMHAEVSFLKIVEEGDKNNFLEVIKSSVLPGSTIISHFFVDYNCHKSLDFANLKKSHSFKYEIPKSGALVKRKNFWDNVRKEMPSHRTTKGFDQFLAEYIWRKRTSDAYDKFRVFLNSIKTIYPPPDITD